MRYIKVILLSLATIAAFSGIVVFTACNKTTCSNIVCLNGGTCSGGQCQCAAGYTGPSCSAKASTGISYTNNTFTPISIAVNGTSATIPVGGTVAFTGTSGSPATGTASTSGTASELGISTAGGVIGMPISWDINNTFPTSDTLNVPLNVGPTYFFLRLQNNYSKNILNYYVNYNFPYGSFYQDVTVPNDGKVYDMGYYLAYTNSNVQTQASDAKISFKAVTLPFTNNQTCTISIP